MIVTMHTVELLKNLPDKPSMNSGQSVLPHRVHPRCPIYGKKPSESSETPAPAPGPVPGPSKPSTSKAISCKPKIKNTQPIWMRRGARPVKRLNLDPLIRCDINWVEKFSEMEPQLQIVSDREWVMRKEYFEVHSTQDVVDGVVINPPAYPAWYKVDLTGKMVPAQLPHCEEILISNAKGAGYPIEKIISRMGGVVAEYSQALVHPRRRVAQEVLVLAGRIWQGAAAIHAARRLRGVKMNVSVYTHGGSTRSEEEFEFMNSGGKIYRNLKDLQGKKFRVVIIALENQYMGSGTILPLFGEWLQNSVAVFVDPPVLKCSYMSALQVACQGAYNISQKTVIFNMGLPKSYILDKFVDFYVVDVGIPPNVYVASGMEYFEFRHNNCQLLVQQVHPQPFKVRGNKIYFYKEGREIL